MRHRVERRKLGRTTAHRKAMLKNMVTSLLTKERVVTTVAKAKEARRLAEKLITLGKKGTIHHRRQAFSLLDDRDVVHLLFTEIAPLFQSRNGGYTRVVLSGNRHGDGASMAVLELVEKRVKAAPAKPKKAAKEKPAKAETAERPEAKREAPKKEDLPAGKTAEEISRPKPEEKPVPLPAKKPVSVPETKVKPVEKKPAEKKAEEKKEKRPGLFGGLKKFFGREGEDK